VVGRVIAAPGYKNAAPASMNAIMQEVLVAPVSPAAEWLDQALS